MNYKTLSDKVRYYKTIGKGKISMNEKLLKLLEEETNEKLLKERVEYFANLLKMGLNVEDIKKALKISDTDYKTIYPLALKLAQ